MANSCRPQSVEISELVSTGMFGLLDAIEKFEPERGFKFETYAMARIKGAILDHLRASDWVPRSVRQKTREVEETIRKLEASLGRAATDEEIAKSMPGRNENSVKNRFTSLLKKEK